MVSRDTLHQTLVIVYFGAKVARNIIISGLVNKLAPFLGKWFDLLPSLTTNDIDINKIVDLASIGLGRSCFYNLECTSKGQFSIQGLLTLEK